MIVADIETVAAGIRTVSAGRRFGWIPGCSQVPVLIAVQARG